MNSIDELRDEIRILRDNNIDTDELVRIADAIEREMEEEYAPLPKDADGVPIHIGDRVENNERVVRITLTDGSWEPSVFVDKAPCVLEEYFCCEVSHYHEPTVEDVLREFALKCEDAGYAGPKVEEIASEFAERLQLKERDDD